MSCLKQGGGEMKVKQGSTLRPGQNELLDQLTSLLSGELGYGSPVYGGQMVAPMTDLQKSGINSFGGALPVSNMSLDAFKKALGGYDPNAANQFLGEGATALSSALESFDPQKTTDYFNKSIKAPALETWQKDIIPQVMERYAGNNAADSGMAQRALAESGGRMNTGLSAQLSDLLFKGEQATKDRQLQGTGAAINMANAGGNVVNQAAGIGNQGMDMLSKIMGAGSIEQGQNQNQLTADYNKWLQGQGYSNPWLQYLNTALGTQSIANMSGVTPIKNSTFSEMAPLLALLAA